MCVSIFMPDGTELTTPLDLLNHPKFYIYGRDLVEPKADYGPRTIDWDWDWCLCGVDVEAVLRRSGLDYEVDPFGYRVVG